MTTASLFLTNGIPLFVTAQTYTHVHLYFCVCTYYSISMFTQIFDHSIYFFIYCYCPFIFYVQIPIYMILTKHSTASSFSTSAIIFNLYMHLLLFFICIHPLTHDKLSTYIGIHIFRPLHLYKPPMTKRKGHTHLCMSNIH